MSQCIQYNRHIVSNIDPEYRRSLSKTKSVTNKLFAI